MWSQKRRYCGSERLSFRVATSTGTEKRLTIDDDTEVSRVQLRLTKSKLREIDQALSQRKVKVSRHVWLLEAIEEKLEKETSS